MTYLDKLINSIATHKKYQNLLFIGIFFFLFLLMLKVYGLADGHDLQSHFGRLNALSQAILDGVYPVYFDQSMALGYGFATKFFYGDLVLLPFALLVPYIGTVKAYYVMIIFYSLLCALLSYIAVNKVFKNNYIAFIFTIIYTFSYYRLYDVYNRAAVGETICLTFFPLVFWGAYEIIKGDYRKWYIITIGFSMMIFAHVNTPAIVAFVLAVICIIQYKYFLKEKKRIWYLLLAAGVTVLLTAYFIFPLFEQLLSNEFYFNTDNGRRLTSNVIKGEDIQHMVRGLFVGTTYMYPEIGGIGIVITMILCFRMFLQRRRSKLVQRADFYMLMGLLCLFIISPLYPWRIFPFNILGFIQFSFRFYAPATFLFCVAAAVYFYEVFRTDARRYKIGIPFLTILVAIMVFNSGRIVSNEFDKGEIEEPSFTNAYHLMGADYMPSVMPHPYTFIRDRANDSIRSVRGDAEISNYKRTLRELSFDVSEPNFELELPLTYYKGYEAEIQPYNGDFKIFPKIPVEQSENGLIQISSQYTGHVKVYFGGTFIQHISPYITLIVAILLTMYILWFNRKSRRRNAR